jgi:hypothetical protein
MNPNVPQEPSQDSEAIRQACAIAKEAAARAIGCLGPSPDRRVRLKVLTAFRHVIYPVKRPGRRRKENITAAHRDWKDGVRGRELYVKHIPDYAKHNHYKREVEARRLMDAIRTRERRERGTKKTENPDDTPPSI